MTQNERKKKREEITIVSLQNRFYKRKPFRFHNIETSNRTRRPYLTLCKKPVKILPFDTYANTSAEVEFNERGHRTQLGANCCERARCSARLSNLKVTDLELRKVTKSSREILSYKQTHVMMRAAIRATE